MAKKKSPAELKEEGLALGKIIAGARKRDHNFAMLISPDGIVLEADPKKPAATMRRLAKANGGGSKGAQGIMRISGKVIELHCEEEDPPPMLVRLAKVHFRDRGQMMKVILKVPGGGSIGDEDDEEEDGAATPEPVTEAPLTEAPVDSPEASVSPDPNDPTEKLREELLAEFQDLQGDLAMAMGNPNQGMATKCEKLAEMFEAECAKDPKRAVKILALLKTTIASALPVAPQSGDVTEGPANFTPAEGERDTAKTPATAEAAFSMISDMFGDLWAQITAPTEGDIAKEAEANAIEEQKARIAALYASGPLSIGLIGQIATEISQLSSMMTTAQQISAMEGSHPEAATEARQAMAGFDQELGAGTVVTPELLQQFEAEKAAAKVAKATATQHLAAAEAMPEGPAKEAALEAARNENLAADTGLATADDRLRAAKGKQMLTQAITIGPLSPNARRPFADQSAAQFVAAFTREPALANFAVTTAATSQNPDAIAGGMQMLADHLQDGFADGEGRTPPAGFDGQSYAKNLIRGAGAEGGTYMQDAEGYLQSGGHLVAEPVPRLVGSNDDVNGRGRDRANFISDAAIGADGTLDVDSPEAQAALGHLRFNPDVIDTPTPSLNAHVMDTYDMLSDPANQQQAQGILDGMETPTGAGQTLVERSGGMITSGNATADDARQAVVTSLMTPVHQGQVGSCFATAGVRRMSETDPLESMERYAELAETGQFRPRNGMDAIPAVLTFPLDEDPLIRSMEYSAATVMAGMEDNSRHEMLQNALDEAVEGLIGPVGDDSTFLSSLGSDNWHVDKQVIRATLIRSFIVEYDATRSTPVSSDGSSSSGVYVLIQVAPTRTVIDNKATFTAALTERVLTGLAIDPSSDKGKEIATVIASSDYLDSMMSGSSAPWNMGGGGMPDEADEVLFGGDKERETFNSARSRWDNLVGTTEGERTVELLENLLESFEGHDEAMMPIMNYGIHAFNALPNHPSTEALRNGDIEDNIEAMILEPGREIAAREFSGDECNRLFAETVSRLKAWFRTPPSFALMDRALVNGIGEGLTPQQVSNATIVALGPYFDEVSLDRANNWQADEVAAGNACNDAARDAKQAEKRAEYVEMANGHSFSGLVDATAPPVFTIADTNWGSAESDVFLVMAPNPLTGEVQMWKQYMPSGRMVPMDEKWVNAEWTEVVEDT